MIQRNLISTIYIYSIEDLYITKNLFQHLYVGSVAISIKYAIKLFM